jgi:hypothetical protein
MAEIQRQANGANGNLESVFLELTRSEQEPDRAS